MLTPKVNSDLLAQVLETAGPKINTLTSTLDGISADIRAVERWLRESGVPFEVSEFVEKESVSDDTVADIYNEGHNHSYLVWCGGKDGKTWRIYYRKDWKILCSQKTGDGDWQQWWDIGHDERPLMETQATVRLKCVDPLARLVSAIAARIPERFLVPYQLSLFK